MSIDAAIHGDGNVIKKYAEKILKYKDLIIEIQRICIVKAKMIPVTTGATGTIFRSLMQYLSNIPGKYEIKELKKHPYWALHTYSEKCQCKSIKHFTGEVILPVAQVVITEQLQHWFVSGI